MRRNGGETLNNTDVNAEVTTREETAVGNPPTPHLSEEAERRRAATQKKRRRKKIIKRIVILIIVLAVVAAAAFGVYKLFFEPEPKPEDITATSYRGAFSSTISGWGQVKASRSASVSIQARGELLELYVSDGDTVNEGDPIFVIDDTSLREQIATAEAALTSLKEQRASVVDSSKKVSESRAEILSQLDEIYKKLASLNVTAPFDGRLILNENAANLAVDSYVEEGTTVATIVDDSSFVLRQYFSYAFENDIAVGDRAEVSIPASMSVLDGEVTRIDKVRRVTNEGAVLFAVEVTVKNSGALTSGMTASAMLFDSNGSEITAYEDGKLEYIRTKDINIPAKGRILTYNMLDFSEYSEGDTLFVISDDGYDEQISSVQDQTKLLDEQITGYEKQITNLDEQIAAKQKEIDTLNGQFDAFNAKAPISGTVMSVMAQPGTMVEAGSAVVTIADTTTMTVDISLDERDVYNVTVGTPAMLMQETSTGSTNYMGTVTSVSLEGKYDYGYGYFPAVITIEGGEGLRSGSSMQYTITLSSKEDCLLVPINAIKYTEQGICVFVKPNEGEEPPENAIELAEGVVPEGYYAVPVETGLSDESQIEITSGIDEGVTLFLSAGQSQDGGVSIYG